MRSVPIIVLDVDGQDVYAASMNKYSIVFMAGLTSLGLLTGCGEEPAPSATKTAPEAASATQEAVSTVPDVAKIDEIVPKTITAPHPAQPAASAHTGDGKLSGSVVETFDAGGFTYILLENGGEQSWAAGPLTKLVAGDRATVFTKMPMKNFHSKSLNRDFELIYFTNKIITDAGKQGNNAAPATSPNQNASNVTEMPASNPVADMSISKAEGGKDSSEIIARKNVSAPAVPAAQMSDGKLSGSVVETFDAGGFTYILLENGGEQSWAAGPLTKLVAGDRATVFTKMPMKNFHSKSLNRDFELIYFTNKIIIEADKQGNNAAPATSPNQNVSNVTETPASSPVTDINISKAKGGKDISEIIAQKNKLAGQTVRVRGKVVKYSSNVLEHNWIHILDGTSKADLTITTNDTVNIDDVIVAEGTLGLGKDFGYGYVYEVILEDASISKE